MKGIIATLILISLVFLIPTCVNSQSLENDPVSWKYNIKKTGNRTYEVIISAIIQNGWHIYAQQQPTEGIALPTTIKFSNNPLVQISGKPKEVGKLEKKIDPILDVEQFQYSNNVAFVQKIQVKGNIKTKIKGSVSFMACTDEKCLPEKEIPFTIYLQN